MQLELFPDHDKKLHLIVGSSEEDINNFLEKNHKDIWSYKKVTRKGIFKKYAQPFMFVILNDIRDLHRLNGLIFGSYEYIGLNTPYRDIQQFIIARIR